MKAKEKTKRCPIEGCWEQIETRKHLCPACTSWWHRVSLKTAEELASYMKRMGRYTGRIGRIRSGRKAA